MTPEIEDTSDLEKRPANDELPASALTPDNSVLSPPDSQRRRREMPTSPTGSSIANSNGKRPLHTISNGIDDMEEVANGKARQEQPVKTHQKSGYEWTRNEDEPGFAWLNKKAIDEYGRAWDSLQHKDNQIGARYGDPFETAEKEKALAASMVQR